MFPAAVGAGDEVLEAFGLVLSVALVDVGLGDGSAKYIQQTFSLSGSPDGRCGVRAS